MDLHPTHQPPGSREKVSTVPKSRADQNDLAAKGIVCGQGTLHFGQLKHGIARYRGEAPLSAGKIDLPAIVRLKGDARRLREQLALELIPFGKEQRDPLSPVQRLFQARSVVSRMSCEDRKRKRGQDLPFASSNHQREMTNQPVRIDRCVGKASQRGKLRTEKWRARIENLSLLLFFRTDEVNGDHFTHAILQRVLNRLQKKLILAWTSLYFELDVDPNHLRAALVQHVDKGC